MLFVFALSLFSFDFDCTAGYEQKFCVSEIILSNFICSFTFIGSKDDVNIGKTFKESPET